MTVEYHPAFFPSMEKTMELYDNNEYAPNESNEYETFAKLVAMYNDEFKIDPPHEPLQAFIDYAKWTSKHGQKEIPLSVYDRDNEVFYIWFNLEGEATHTVTDLEGLLEVFSSIVRSGLPLEALVDILGSLRSNDLIEIQGTEGDVGHLIVATGKRKKEWLRLLIKRGLITPDKIPAMFEEAHEKDLPNNE